MSFETVRRRQVLWIRRSLEGSPSGRERRAQGADDQLAGTLDGARGLKSLRICERGKTESPCEEELRKRREEATQADWRATGISFPLMVWLEKSFDG